VSFSPLDVRIGKGFMGASWMSLKQTMVVGYIEHNITYEGVDYG